MRNHEIPERDKITVGLTPLTEGLPWDDLGKILHESQRMARVQNDKEILPKVSTS